MSADAAWHLAHVRALAYMGDAVYEMHVRERVLRTNPGMVDALHRTTVRRVSAEGQAEMAERLLPLLSEEEQSIYRRARNHKGMASTGRASARAYRLSTAFEAVLGYLYLKPAPGRLAELLALTDTWTEEMTDAP
ncbi:MAG: ribonuclease III domain-containing protein [Candidatus Sericytochromatia bacterium]|nr:ribonuclease III domain-containing protein [Candidatus Sericytochromatia bacterium]